jgi:hypothetical protein
MFQSHKECDTKIICVGTLHVPILHVVLGYYNQSIVSDNNVKSQALLNIFFIDPTDAIIL